MRIFADDNGRQGKWTGCECSELLFHVSGKPFHQLFDTAYQQKKYMPMDLPEINLLWVQKIVSTALSNFWTQICHQHVSFCFSETHSKIGVNCSPIRASFAQSILALQDGSMFKAQVEFAPYFYLQVKASTSCMFRAFDCRSLEQQLCLSCSKICERYYLAENDRPSLSFSSHISVSPCNLKMLLG